MYLVKHIKYQNKLNIVTIQVIIALVLLKAYKSKSKVDPFNLMVLIAAACISPYVTNCVSKGKCEKYGWYLSISNMIVATSLLLAFIKI